MKCDKIKEMLSLYIDQMLDDNMKKEIEEHISTCNLCKKEYDDIKNMTILLNEVEMVPVPESFENKMKKALQQEKAKLSDAKIVAMPAKKKKLRMLTSIAAIFTVGFISFGLYQYVIGDLPEQLDGTAQSYQNRTLAGQSESEFYDTDLYEANLYKSNMHDITKEVEKRKTSSGDTDEMDSQDVPEQRMDIYGHAESFEQESKSALIPKEYTRKSSTGDDTDGDSKDIQIMMVEDEFSRAVTTSGIERNVAAIQYYKGLIEDKLRDFRYEILDADFVQAGECRFRIYIYSGKDGYKFNEEIFAVGKDCEIEFIYTNEFMGL